MWASRHEEDLWANVANLCMHSHFDSSGYDGPIPSDAADHNLAITRLAFFERSLASILACMLRAETDATLVNTQNSANYAVLVSS